MKKLLIFFEKNWDIFSLAFLVIVAAVLRFANITKLQFFTYDQARDALFVKRMIVEKQFRLLGTQTSLPGMYLPPFYYYTIAVVLWLSGLNPVGIDIYSALIGVLSVPLVFLVANKIFGRPAGFFSAGLFAVSPLVVELTRRAWNPNTLPFYVLIAFYFLYQYFKEGKTKDFLLAFVFYGYCLSLHFGAWTLLPLFAILWFYDLSKNNNLKRAFMAAAIIIFFISPLLFFELRHSFFLTSQAKIFFFDGKHLGTGLTNVFESFFTSLIALFTILISGKISVGYEAPLEFQGKIGEFFHKSWPISVVAQKPFSLSFQWWGTLIFILILYLSYRVLKAKKKEKNSLKAVILAWIWIIWGIFASRLYSGKFFFFYYLFLFPAPILLFGYLFKKGFQEKTLKIPTITAFLLILLFHLRFSTVFLPAWRDYSDLFRIGRLIGQNVLPGETFNLATIQRESDRWDRNAVDYRYFTETVGGQRALDWYPEDYQKATTLFVVDETGEANVLKSNIMEIETFLPEKIVGQWDGGKGIVIYKISKKAENK